MLTENELSEKIIGAAIEVHRHLGPGLLESAYRECLAREFSVRDVPFEKEKPLPLSYKGVKLDCGYRLDFVVGLVVVGLKAVDRLLPVHTAQMLTYLRLTGCKLGLLINFSVATVAKGIKRIALGL